MGQVLHGSATTTEAIRRAIQHSQESLRALAKRYGINPKTVAKWKKRGSVADLQDRAREPKSTSLSVEDEAIIVAFRKHTLLPLDDCLYALQATIPHLTRSSLHRCLQRHGISRLPDVEDGKAAKNANSRLTQSATSISTSPRSAPPKEALSLRGHRPNLEVRLHRTARESVPTRVAADFLRALINAVPYKIHTVLTDNGIHFTDPSGQSWTAADIKEKIERKEPFWAHAFVAACARNNIDHRLTKPRHPWTNGQVERMNRTIKDATVKRFYYETHDELRSHLADFVSAYNFAKRLKTLKGLTPYEYICRAWTKEPERFNLNPLQQMPGLNT